MNKLVIVESPAKAKTIKKYLGKDFVIIASYGHVRDLLPKKGAVLPDKNFAMKYELIEKNTKHVEAIDKALRAADALYLATDPDREGEAIAWHVYEIMRERKLLKKKPVYRVVFHEITKTAVKDAVENPRELAINLVNAQQTRRALDYLVGFNLSPLLWKKVARGLSAGRVQSPALRLICEREEEIAKFVTQEYWSVQADTESHQQAFSARLIEFAGEKLTQFSITNQEQADKVQQELAKADHLLVSKVDKKKRLRNPTAPFITSTLQQEAVRKLGFTAKRAMMIAQQLYEGIDIGGGAVGLITYMRTDSVHLANEALEQIREFIAERYGKKQLPSEPRQFKSKSKNAQEAHEAVRPTSVAITPESIQDKLTPEQFKLYELIWKRTVASQMNAAVINTVAADLACGENNCFRANGSTVVEPGFMMVYQEDKDDQKSPEAEVTLPPLIVGDKLPLKAIHTHQHFTEPPPRYGEASLVKTLEEYGIGRPSTYASIISTLVDRQYVNLENKRFYPTDVGKVVNKFLSQHFNQYVDYDFTANLENQLDDIACGEKEWIPILENFWAPFKNQIDHIDESVTRQEVTQEKLDEKCPKCEKELTIRLGRRGRFIGCSGFPECDYTRDINENAAEATASAEIIEGRECPKCQNSLILRNGRYGKFIGCSKYPECNFIEPLVKPKATEITCPACQQGQIVQRRSRYGKIFYSCERYPDCKYALWNEPIAEACPNCHWPILTLKVTKTKGSEKICQQEGCGFKEKVVDSEAM